MRDLPQLLVIAPAADRCPSPLPQLPA